MVRQQVDLCRENSQRRKIELYTCKRTSNISSMARGARINLRQRQEQWEESCACEQDVSGQREREKYKEMQEDAEVTILHKQDRSLTVVTSRKSPSFFHMSLCFPISLVEFEHICDFSVRALLCSSARRSYVSI